MFNFEKLSVWHKAIEYADGLYDATETFPERERFGLTNRRRRAAVSISSNIAEGSSRSSSSDYSRFLEIAYGSLMETVSQMSIAKNRRFLDDDAFGRLYGAADEPARMLSGLRASVRNGRP